MQVDDGGGWTARTRGKVVQGTARGGVWTPGARGPGPEGGGVGGVGGPRGPARGFPNYRGARGFPI